MQTTTTEDVIIQKTKDLCQAILDQPEYRAIRRRVDRFMADDEAKTQYQSASEQGEYLHHKQQQGIALTDQEIAAFEKHRDAVFTNPVTRDFLDAQKEIHQMQESVNQYLSKTFELGRVPSEDELDSGSCGHGCGCSH
jgi:cell fate (sporulation/competence/biofilm development) regulator YlbF (YheA/YmcA/DUF963 family)